jgi:hypothetical protein
LEQVYSRNSTNLMNGRESFRDRNSFLVPS